MISNICFRSVYRLGIFTSALGLAACLCSGLSTPNPTPASRPAPTLSPTATATLSPITTQVEALATDRIPTRDRYDLAVRFKGITASSSPVASAQLPQVGDEASFWVDNTSTDAVSQIKARLVYAGQHVSMWIEDGLDTDLSAVKASADRFDQQTYATDRANFGWELLPGIDNDPRVNILNNTKMGSEAAGYFNSPSEYPASIVPNSNQKEMIYMNWDALRPGNAQYDEVLAHEFQHMIHWNVDPNEDTWVNEGMSEVAAYLNGFGLSSFAPSFMGDPDTQLNAWEENGDNSAHYGAAFLFNLYFLDRFGQDDLRALVKNPQNGLDGFDTTLASLKTGLTSDDLFKDWVIANFVNDPALGQGHYGYTDLHDLPEPAVRQTVEKYPAGMSDQVHQFAAHYIQLKTPGKVKVHFEGQQQVAILPTRIGSGDTGARGFVWWSNRADDSDMSLTREVDLSSAQTASIEFDLWYGIEENWDYGYVEVSPDGGHTWRVVKTEAGTISNPHGNAYGPGYTGQSTQQPGADSAGWLHQTASLDSFVGKKILLRFEMITDDAVNLPGIALDNICIHAIGWCDDAESQQPGWDAQGFVWMNNVIPQRYVVQAIIPGADGSISVVTLALDDANTGDLEIVVGNRPVTLVIAGLTRHTTEPAPYRLEITPASP